MTQKEITAEIKWLTTWGKWCRKQYLKVEPDRKPLYKQVMEDTLAILKSYETYTGEEKEYSFDDIM